MLETRDILEKIDGISNNLLPIQFKNSETGETFGFEYCYIEDEILFLIASPKGQATIINYLSFLDFESEDDSWNSHVDHYAGPLSEACMTEARYDVVTGLETFAYVGDLNKSPIRHFDETFKMKSAEVTEDALVLTF